MLDKTLPYYPVIMTKQPGVTCPQFFLPQGYVISGYQPGWERAWAELMYAVGQTGSLREAEGIFAREFFAQPQWLSSRCLFVLDHQGKVAAAASLWHGEHFGKSLPRIHWVAARQDQQGKGLVKALLTRLLDMAAQLAPKEQVYLTSQTWSFKAVHLYSQFGFVPYLGPRPANWQDNAFECHAVTAWKIIRQRLEETGRIMK